MVLFFFPPYLYSKEPWLIETRARDLWRSALFVTNKGHAKLKICIENKKSKKLETWPSSKIISDEGHVFQNAKICKIKEIETLAHQENFFCILQNDRTFQTLHPIFRQMKKIKRLHIWVMIFSRCQVSDIGGRG